MKNKFFRGRRLRQNEHLRSLVQEVYVTAHDLIAPIFVTEGKKKRIQVEAMPGIERVSVDELPSEIDIIRASNISSVLVFGIPTEKDGKATLAWKENNLVQRAVETIKRHDPSLTVMTDICLCAYTDHGHCGHLDSQGRVTNDDTLETLSKMAVTHAQGGADVVAPSDMMDGRVGAIRRALDENNFIHVPILSYAAKYASAFYGPFREATQCGIKGDRKTYQMDPHNVREALREIRADLEEGADMVMVKPALAYLDVIRAAREHFDAPLFAYSVSGEYSMIKACAARGWINERAVVMEILTAIKRAGADRIISYFAKDFKKFQETEG